MAVKNDEIKKKKKRVMTSAVKKVAGRMVECEAEEDSMCKIVDSTQ